MMMRSGGHFHGRRCVGPICLSALFRLQSSFLCLSTTLRFCSVSSGSEDPKTHGFPVSGVFCVLQGAEQNILGELLPRRTPPPPTEFILDTTREGTRIGTHGNPCLLLNPARTTSQATRPYGPAAAPRSQPNPSLSLEYQFLTKNKLGHWRPAQPGCDSFSGRPYPCRPYGLVA